ncbi:MAG: DoxX family protein [Candidatus Pacebacteria bacterium]|nr:DoxX family protein [Candidatus Paceibacterota bacterium]
MIYIFYIARILFGGYFLLNGFNHFKNLNSLAGYAGSMKIPSPKTAVTVTGVLMLIGGLGILLWFMVPIAVLAIVIFLIPTSFMMHAYWKMSDPMMKMNQKIQFQKNMAILAGALAFLLLLY